jgi:hypothetical protein
MHHTSKGCRFLRSNVYSTWVFLFLIFAFQDDAWSETKSAGHDHGPASRGSLIVGSEIKMIGSETIEERALVISFSREDEDAPPSRLMFPCGSEGLVPDGAVGEEFKISNDKKSLGVVEKIATKNYRCHCFVVAKGGSIRVYRDINMFAEGSIFSNRKVSDRFQDTSISNTIFSEISPTSVTIVGAVKLLTKSLPSQITVKVKLNENGSMTVISWDLS